MSAALRRELQDAVVQLACCAPETLKNLEQQLEIELTGLQVAGFRWTDGYNARAALKRIVAYVIATTERLNKTIEGTED